jgi:hypothetical protein
MIGRLNRFGVASAVAAIALSWASALVGATAAAAQDKRVEFAELARSRNGGLSTAVEVAASADSLRAHLQRLSERDVKQFYLGCSAAAMRGRLGGGETAACSVGYEVLLQRHFGGDFHALLAWSRKQAHDGN